MNDIDGLIPGWEALPRVPVHIRATSASGPERDETFMAIPLCRALPDAPSSPLAVSCADGLTLLLSAADAERAFLAPLPGGIWQLILPQDSTRRRWAKNPVSFGSL